jgi:hypothetical protein
VGKSFNRVGNDLLQILVIFINEEIKIRMKIIPPSSSDDSQSKSKKSNDDQISEGYDDPSKGEDDVSRYTHDLVIRKATKIIGHFARVGQATRPMAGFPRFLR